SSISRDQMDAVTTLGRIDDVGSSHQFRASFHGERDEERIKLDAPDHKRSGFVRFDRGLVAVRTLQVEPRDGMGRDSRQLRTEMGKPPKNPKADPAPARLVSR